MRVDDLAKQSDPVGNKDAWGPVPLSSPTSSVAHIVMQHSKRKRLPATVIVLTAYTRCAAIHGGAWLVEQKSRAKRVAPPTSSHVIRPWSGVRTRISRPTVAVHDDTSVRDGLPSITACLQCPVRGQTVEL
ncbi:Uncharacterized protein PBTT_08396 [Plasmodiophora brassicae]